MDNNGYLPITAIIPITAIMLFYKAPGPKDKLRTDRIVLNRAQRTTSVEGILADLSKAFRPSTQGYPPGGHTFCRTGLSRPLEPGEPGE